MVARSKIGITPTVEAGGPVEGADGLGDLLVDLLRCESPESCAQCLADWARQHPGLQLDLWQCDPYPRPVLGEEPERQLLHAVREAIRTGEQGDVSDRAGRPLGLWPLTGASRFLLVGQGPALGTAACLHQLASLAPLLERVLERQVETSRLRASLARLEQSQRLQSALFAIADLASSGEDMDRVFARLHEIVGELMYAENFYIALFDIGSGTLRFPYYRDSVETELPPPDRAYRIDEMAGSLTRHVLTSGQTLMGTPEELDRALGQSFEPVGAPCVDWLGVPLLRGETVIGAVVVQSYTEAQRYGEDDRALLTFVAQHIATAVERKLAHEELERRVAQRTDQLREANRVLEQEVQERRRGERLQAALFRIAQLATTSESIEAFYAAVHGVVSDLLYARNFYIALLSDDREHLTFPYSVDEFDPQRRPRRLGRGMTEYVLRTGRAVLAGEGVSEELYRRGEVMTSGTESVCWLGVPLVCEDRTVGVLAVQSYSQEHYYGTRDQELLTFVSYHIATALERKRADDSLKAAYLDLERRVDERTAELASANVQLREEIGQRQSIEARLMHDALHDALTGLPNRSYLLDRLKHALERYARHGGDPYAVLFLDLDRFKVINDSVGHLVGDDLLKDVAARIARCVAGKGLVARLGGDEFAVLLEPVTDVRAPGLLAQRIIDGLTEPFRVAGKELFTSASVGIALGAVRYRKPEELLRDADVALYRAKAEGRHRYVLFDERLHQEALRLLELEGDLRRALARAQFEPWFQPIIRLADGCVVGYEALLRWRHPQRGLLLPAEFLAVAEDNGLVESIDWQMFEAACRLGRSLIHGSERFLSVNVSAQHFRAPQLAEKLIGLLVTTGVDARQLRLEVTEGTLLENPADVRSTLLALREAGIEIALDDFGTGYSSLSYLHQFPLNALKIDRSFIAAVDVQPEGSGTAVVRAVLTLAQALRLQVVAEGVETEQQRRILCDLGCEFGQGFLFARPSPAAAIRAFS
ncbi:MAG TPA: EAL domain-containing protein [Xanthomonadaceae bacterium]|nr:EAL domain-containing protein [Xanthomonadaceae bacterium]